MQREQTQALPQAAPPRGRRWVTVLIVATGLLALAGFSFLKFSAGPSLRLETCFQDVNGLRRGSTVRLAGVDIGVVREVRAKPTDKACPGSVEMEIRTPYELRIPKDSVASTATEGLLGPTFLEIDVSGASGPPIQTGGQLPSKESVNFTAATIDRMLKAVELLKQLSDEEKNSHAEPANRSDRKPSPKPSPSSVPK
jgi:phospholipid/cholesterol/gamma-HCH transport system substrate-binding protein